MLQSKNCIGLYIIENESVLKIFLNFGVNIKYVYFCPKDETHFQNGTSVIRHLICPRHFRLSLKIKVFFYPVIYSVY